MNNRGSFTVEAALALPVFIFSIVAFIFLFRVLLLQIQLQGAMTEASNKMQGLLYIEAKEPINGHKVSQFKSVAYKVLTKTEIEKYFLKRKRYDAMLIEPISYLESNYQAKEGNMDLVADYKVKIPLPIVKLKGISVCQRVRTRAFIGVDRLLSLNNSGNNNQGQMVKYVYITETGTVYHLHLQCSALNLKISECKITDIENKRNASGGKYKRCERCFKGNEEVSHVLICEDGDRYHVSLSCSGLKRTIKKVPLEEARKKMRGCYRCGTKESN